MDSGRHCLFRLDCLLEKYMKTVKTHQSLTNNQAIKLQTQYSLHLLHFFIIHVTISSRIHWLEFNLF